MTSYLSDDIYAGLEAGRRVGQSLRRSRTVVAGNQVYPILSFDDCGFTVRTRDAKAVRGRVEIRDGGELICEALIVASAQEGDNIRFEYKRNTPVAEIGALDFLRSEVETAAGLREVA